MDQRNQKSFKMKIEESHIQSWNENKFDFIVTQNAYIRFSFLRGAKIMNLQFICLLERSIEDELASFSSALCTNS